MANDGILKTNAFDQLVRDASSFDEMREALHRAQGLVSTEQTIIDGGYRTAPAEPASAPLSVAAAPTQAQGTSHTHERIVYPHLNDRYLLTGFSEEELDRKESAIRAMYQR